MGLLDKINLEKMQDKASEFAKKAGDAAETAIETTKLNAKIKSEMNAAEDEYAKIGEFYYNQYIAGTPVAPDVEAMCQSAKAHLEAAAEAKAELEKIKAEA